MMDFFNINNIRTPTTKHTPHKLPRVLDSLPLNFSSEKKRFGWLKVVIYGKIMVARNYDKKGMEMVEKGNGNG